MIVSWQESDDKPRQCVEKQRLYSANKGPYSQGYGLPSGHVHLWELNSKEGGAQRIMPSDCGAGETPESPLDSKIKPVNLKGNQFWILIGRTDAWAEAPVFWSSNANSGLIGKVPEAGKDWGQEEKKVSEDKKSGWHHQHDGHEVGQTLGGGGGQGGCPWDRLQTTCCSLTLTKSQTRLGDWTTTDSGLTKLQPQGRHSSLQMCQCREEIRKKIPQDGVRGAQRTMHRRIPSRQLTQEESKILPVSLG